ncbi:glutathione S-transferase [Streptococcus dysgalactiae]|nr:glutathione S-transferase [Streptococcus dysgalactiae]
MTSYHIPEIWENKGRMSGLNADTAGSRFEEILPKGKKPYNSTPLDTKWH